ncbi:713e0eec-ffbb-4749-886f-a37cc987178a [Sclerotinia trifoliorum]|uniref:713e0eec-ffbb-4749-886f-a37cc987178a n=1 Tax=Sclerotinia trifoliorum TaxID=28548 RepID=A0A8H2ZLM9_9HELO|nr:713e0eec-ffbb-4749-886f-a37cc987178a [Sclerotinia trifoliorum]
MMQIFFLESFQWSGIGEHDDELIKFQIRCFGAKFEIQYTLQNLSLSPNLLEQYQSSLAIMRACEVGDNRDGDKAFEEILRLKKPFEELIIELAPNPPPSCNQLSDYLYPPFLILEAKAAAQDSTIIQPHFKGQLPRQIRFPAGEYISPPLDWLNLVKSSTSQQIQLVPSPDLEQHPCLRGPGKVIAEDGALCYYKELPSLSAVAEAKSWIHIQIPAAIEAKKLRSDIRICRLHSVVVDDDREVLQHWYSATEKDLVDEWRGDISDDWTPEEYADPNFDIRRVVGILLHYIDSKGTLEQIVPWSDCLDEHRHRWAIELEDLVGELHAAGLVWGDAKPHNVLVDRDDKLWLIDLEGGYTLGWVDEANKNSQEGDLQGVKRIKEWLAKWSKKSIDRIVH